MKVNFFIIGPPRCASTSISTLLASHPSVCFSQPKEPTFFCEDIPTGYENMPETIEEYYQTYFSHYDQSEHSLIGEGTPFYLMSECAIAKIIDYNPEAKFIALARNPIEIAYSMHTSKVKTGLRSENIPDFEDAWHAQEDRLRGKRLPKNVIREAVLQYKRLGSIGTQYERLFSLAPREKIHVIIFDDLISDREKETEKLFNFLGLDLADVPQIEHKEANTQWSSEYRRQSYELLKRIANIVPFSPNFGILKHFRKTSLQPAQRKQLRPEFRKHLRQEFDEEINKFSKIIGRDFTHWK